MSHLSAVAAKGPFCWSSSQELYGVQGEEGQGEVDGGEKEEEDRVEEGGRKKKKTKEEGKSCRRE